MNEIIGKYFSGNSFAGYLATTPNGVVIFGHDADWCDENGQGEENTRSSYAVDSFSSVEEARTYLIEVCRYR
jgi:hypothetical protein